MKLLSTLPLSLLGLVCLVGGCAGYDEIDYVPLVFEISPENAPDSLQVGTSIQLVPTIRNQYNQIPGLNEVSWEVSDQSILQVNDTGVVTGISSGIGEVRMEYQSITQRLSLVVTTDEVKQDTGATSYNGSFQGVGGYQVNGVAQLSSVGTGSFTLQFNEAFSVSSTGIALEVHLSATAASTGINLGDLKKVSGTQEYTVPAGYSIAQNPYVVIYCQPAGIPFGHALLQ